MFDFEKIAAPLMGAFLAVSISAGGADTAQAQDLQLSEATQVSVIPSPEGLSGVEGMRTAGELSKGIEVFPVTVNLSYTGAKDKETVENVIRESLAHYGAPNVWVHFNINNTKGTTLTFWAAEVPHSYPVDVFMKDPHGNFKKMADIHNAHRLAFLEEAAGISLSNDN